MKNVELKNLGITIDVDKFQEEFKEKNLAFFKALDKSIEDNSIKVFHAIADEYYYNLIVVCANDTYNAFPEPMFLEYMTLEDLNDKIQLEEIERDEIDKVMKVQRNNSYVYLKNKEDKAKMVLSLIAKTKEKLTKNEIEEIVNECDGFLEIKIIEDAKDFAEELTLTNNSFMHSWAGGWSDIEKITHVFFMDDEFKEGLDYHYEYSNNGNTETEEENYIEPNFNVNSKYAIIKTKEYDDNFNNNYDNSFEKNLIIYLPHSDAYKMDKQVKYILENFNI